MLGPYLQCSSPQLHVLLKGDACIIIRWSAGRGVLRFLQFLRVGSLGEQREERLWGNKIMWSVNSMSEHLLFQYCKTIRECVFYVVIMYSVVSSAPNDH